MLGLSLSVARASGAPVFAPATAYSSLPADAMTGGGAFAVFEGLSCTAVGECAATGYYKDANSNVQGMAAALSGGTWAQATPIALPSGAATAPGVGFADLRSTACTSVGSCVAAGFYKDASHFDHAMLATESGGTWAQATQVTLPSDASTSAPDDALQAVACPAPGSCVAGGYYMASDKTLQPMIVTETNGSWSPAIRIVLPSDASTATGAQLAQIQSLACTSVGICVAGGSYEDMNGSGDTQAMLVTETNGTWGTAVRATLPSGAATAAGMQSASILSLACPSDGNCTAAGSYSDTNGNQLPMAAGESNGTWAQATAITLPANATTAAGTQRSGGLSSLSCWAVGACVATGSYNDTNGSKDQQALVASEDGGSWSKATELTLPTDAATATGAQTAAAYRLACPQPDRCLVAGRYNQTSGGVLPMTVVSQPLLSQTRTSVPGATVGAPYSQTLAAAGGAAPYRWAVTAGALPAGLKLDPAYGTISGTPTQAGAASFTVTVTDSGPPVQQASQPLSIQVAPAPALGVVLTKAMGTTLKVTLACVGSTAGACSGTLALTSVEHFTGRTLTADTARRRTRPARRTKRILTDATATYSLAGGQTLTVKLVLGKTAQKLLAARLRLPARLTVTPTGQARPAKTAAITFVLAQRKRGKHKH
jgi:hypothetical protein